MSAPVGNARYSAEKLWLNGADWQWSRWEASDIDGPTREGEAFGKSRMEPAGLCDIDMQSSMGEARELGTVRVNQAAT